MPLVLFIHIFKPYLHSFNHIYTIHLSVSICEVSLHLLITCKLSGKYLSWVPSRDFELGLALQQADALPTELRRALLLLIRRMHFFGSKSVSKETVADPDLADAVLCRSIWKKRTIPEIIYIYETLIFSILVAQTCDSMWAPRFVQRDPAQGELDAFKVNTTYLQ
jgi:hypothetical protein